MILSAADSVFHQNMPNVFCDVHIRKQLVLTPVSGTASYHSLNDEESQLFCQYYNLLNSKLTGTPHRHQKELINALLQAFIYEFQDSMEKYIQLKPVAFNSSNNLFNAFMELLISSYPKERSVSYYANRLFVTSKYLSAVCKENSGETASDLITCYVMKDIVCLLKSPDKSIKEIANELNFATLSFFGKYVKRNLGLSPKEYREKLSQQEGNVQ